MARGNAGIVDHPVGLEVDSSLGLRVGDVEHHASHLDACLSRRVHDRPRLRLRARAADGVEAPACEVDDSSEPDAGARAGGQDSPFHCADNLPSLPMRVPDPLALRELSALLRDPVFRGRGVPRGDGRPVLLVPGFLSGDWSMTVMNGWLQRIGYKAYMSGIYFNVRASEHMLAGLRRRIADIYATNPSRVTLIGHSRGGLLAKVLAQRRPNDIEQVIALGSPLADQSDITPLTQAAVGVVRTANEIGFGVKLRAEGRFAYDLRQPPAVPTTSIYTRSDDVVNFRSCIRPDIPSIAVWGSHNGLVINPEVYRLLGRLLARPRRPPAARPARAPAR
jgi:pimeloyl-ACP methyl ester carboxylesterase